MTSTIPPIFIVIITFGMLFVILNSLTLGLRVHVGQIIAHFFQNWQLALLTLVFNFIVIPLLVIGWVTLVDASIPAEVKLGFCIAALAAGAPFAPALTRIARADVATSGSLMIVLMVVTLVALPLAMPAAAATVDPGVTVSAWDVAWPLLFFVVPLLIGIIARLRWPDVAAQGARLFGPISLTCLIIHVALYVIAAWNEFTSAWDTGSYAAAIAVPLITIASGYVLGFILGLKDVGTRHAFDITTGQRNVSAGLIMCLIPFAAYPLASVSFLVINFIGIVILLVFSLEWGRALAKKESLADATATEERHAVTTVRA
jgi:BASS family bile acid:Na+ symporter